MIMKISLDLNKSIEENASAYFEKAKKARKKIKGAEEAVGKLKKRLEKEQAKLEEKLRKQEEEENSAQKTRKLEWYEKFRWFISSEGFLVIGGRDSTTNEIIIKKHTDSNDIIFHTDMAGSPFFVIKNPDNKEIGEQTITETADATCTYSKAWKLGLATTSVFWVKPDQVSKEAESGEYMAKGAFMIRGKTNYIPAKINLAIGSMEDSRVMGGPLSAVKENCKAYVEVVQGNDKTAAVAKKVKAKIGDVDLDDIIKVIPAGGAKIK
ncbi:DUF814 domain-containing protein [Candidatus Woesearchaeota archaeon]|nr:DUF814 domain-containing protein [Candidatus Woesearchaeota archaeon]